MGGGGIGGIGGIGGGDGGSTGGSGGGDGGNSVSRTPSVASTILSSITLIGKVTDDFPAGIVIVAATDACPAGIVGDPGIVA